MNDLISRQAAIDAHELLLKDCNPDHFVAHEKFIGFMDDTEIGSFGDWQFANGFNLALTAGEVAIKEQPTIDAVEVVRCRDCKWYEIYQLKKDGTDDLRYKPSYCVNLAFHASPDWFCADGERRRG